MADQRDHSIRPTPTALETSDLMPRNLDSPTRAPPQPESGHRGGFDRLPSDGALVRSWLVLGGVLAALCIGLYGFLDQQQRRMIDEARDAAAQELLLLSRLVGLALQNQAPEQVEYLLQFLGSARPDIQEIRLERPDGALVARFFGSPGPELIRGVAQVPHIQPGFSLVLVKGGGHLEQQWSQVRLGMAALGLALAVAYGVLVWIGLRQRRWLAVLRRRSLELPQLRDQLQRLAEDKARLRACLTGVLDGSQSILILVDQRERIVEWNQAAVEFTHVPREDALGLPVTDVLPHLDGLGESLSQALLRPGESEPNRFSRVVGGALRQVEVVIARLDEPTEPMALIQVTDVTTRVALERRMLHLDKLVVLGGLVNRVVREIISPLSGLLQNAQNLARRLGTTLAPNQQAAAQVGLDLDLLQAYLARRKIPELLELLRESAQQAGRVAGDLMRFSRRGGAGLQKAALADLLDGALNLTAADLDMVEQYQFHSIQIERDYDPQAPLIRCDTVRIQQALIALLKNSAQAMATAVPRCLRLTVRGQGHEVLVQVADNGPGLDPQIRARLLQPLVSAGEVGLGLAVVHLIVVEQHGGRVEIQPEPGPGCWVSLCLPLEPPREPVVASV